MTERSRFAGGDQAYLRDEQYVDSTRVAARANLHARYRTAEIGWFDWLLPRLDLRSGDEVLEAGCGPGWLWAESMVPIPPDVHLTLTDLSPGMVDEAVTRVVASGRVDHVAGRPADLQELPFADATFDRVTANHMLYHLPDPGLGVAELARVVRPDGPVITATNGRRHLRELWEIRAEVFGVPATDQTFDVFGAEVGFGHLRDHFEEVAWWRYEDELRCTDPADVLAFLCSTPPAEDADDAQRAELERAIARRFSDGTFTITKDVGCFVSRRPRR